MQTLAALTLSTSSLECFSQCPRLFRYRYLEDAYLSLPTDLDQERSIRLGNDFHRLIELLTPLSPRERTPWLGRIPPELAPWWQDFQRSGLDTPLGKVYSEVSLWFTWKGYRFVVRFDRLHCTPEGKWQIWDWKTSKQRPSPGEMSTTWQYRLYPLALCLGATPLGLPIAPDQVSMHFWFAQHPQKPHNFTYSSQRFAQDRQHLEQTLALLEEAARKDFPKTDREVLCHSCFFRSQCWGMHPIGTHEWQLQLFTETDDSTLLAAEELME